MKTCFFAYPSYPPSIPEVMTKVIDHINNTGTGFVSARGWETLRITGKLIISEVCDAINNSDLFVCDLTFFNPNVLFELGYAVAKNKRIWITLDTSYNSAKTNYQKLGLLSTVGYAEYNNSHHLTNQFFKEEPYKDSDSTLYKDMIESIVESKVKPPSLFYLKCSINTQSSVQLSRRLEKATFNLIVDDPTEVSRETLTWYARNTNDAYAIIAHLLDEKRADKESIQNGKYAFISGMAYGFGKPLLMLAHAPYHPPIDYKDLLIIHETANECIDAVDIWLPIIEERIQEDHREYLERRTHESSVTAMQMVYLGEHIAENEQKELMDYFVETAPYIEALNTTKSRIFIGRKGSGKTANLFMIADKLSVDPRNHICIIKPVDYELEGVIDLLSSKLTDAEKGFLLESLWKYLIYSELAISVYDELKKKPDYLDYSNDERIFLEFVEKRIDIIEVDFSLRLEKVIKDLQGVNNDHFEGDRRFRVSELLHEELLAELREYLGKILDKKRRVCILVDNLDKAWKSRENIRVLALFLLGLLNISNVIPQEFHKRGISWRSVNLSLLIFLRSDIFSYIMSVASEPDKIIFTRIKWDDPILLNRVIEERFVNSLPYTIPSNEVWERFFVPNVKGKSTKEYLINRIHPRPRDVLYLCKIALANAINRKHIKIQEDDILRSEMEYSEQAFYTLMSETAAHFGEIESLLVEFAGATEIVTRDEIDHFFQNANVPIGKSKDVISLLCESQFLGLETNINEYTFIQDESRKNIIQSLANTISHEIGVERYKIAIPYHAFLGIQSDDHER